MASSRAHFFNICCRLFMKPILRMATLKFLTTTIPNLINAQAKVSHLPPELTIKTVDSDGFKGEYLKHKNRSGKTVILAFPGGGFIMRARNQHLQLMLKICKAGQLNSLITHYGLAPETPFPGGLENCIASYEYLLAQGVAANDIVLLGESAGGGLVLSTLLALRDRGIPMPGAGIVISPLADLTFSGKTREVNAWRDPMLPNSRNSKMHELYIGDADAGHPYLSPALADLTGLPPLLGMAGSTEILLDDAVRAAEQAEKAGVPFILEIWKDMPHAFPLFGFIPEGKVAVTRIAEFALNRQLPALDSKLGISRQY